MSRTFYHNLYIVIPGTFCKFSQTNKFFNLAYICCICKTSRTAGVAKRNCYIILFADIKNFIIVFIEWVLFACHTHPCKYKASATAYDIHFSFMFFNLLDCFSCNSTVKCDEINTVFCVHTDNIDKIMSCKCCEVTLIVDNTVINRNSSDHNRTFACQFATERLSISMA